MKAVEQTLFTVFDDANEEFFATTVFLDTNSDIVTIHRKDCSKLLTRRRCAIYLHKFDHCRNFSKVEVERCYWIFRTLAIKASYINYQKGNTCAIFYDGDHHIIHMRTAEEMIESFFDASDLIVHCYNRNKLHYWFSRGEKRPIFRIQRLIQEEESFKIFMQFWESVPSADDIREVLRPFFPEEIIHKILCVE